jgi:hypothetical protein
MRATTKKSFDETPQKRKKRRKRAHFTGGSTYLKKRKQRNERHSKLFTKEQQREAYNRTE